MIRRLKRKFIIVAMASVFCVLALLIGAINVINYAIMNRYADDRLDVIRENDGLFPRVENIHGGKREPFGEMSPEAPFDTRYFTVTISDDGSVQEINTGRIAAVSTETAADYALELYRSGGVGGFVDDYKYTVTDSERGNMYIFLDCGRELASFRSFLGTSVLISIAGLVLVLILVWGLSGIALNPAVESYAKQNRFITDAGHEIKTPLTIIDAAVELVEMENGESRWTKSIRTQVSRLTGLTEKLVLLTRMDEEGASAERIEFSLSDAVRESAELFDAVAIQGGKRFIVNVPDGIVYKGDEGLIRQMMSLLLDNAMKYSDIGGTVSVSLTEIGRSKNITVTNTVEYIEKGDHSELFGRFYRPDSSRNSETGGHGIGLSVVEAIVRLHGGKATAFSDDTGRISFTVII